MDSRVIISSYVCSALSMILHGPLDGFNHAGVILPLREACLTPSGPYCSRSALLVSCPPPFSYQQLTTYINRVFQHTLNISMPHLQSHPSHPGNLLPNFPMESSGLACARYRHLAPRTRHRQRFGPGRT